MSVRLLWLSLLHIILSILWQRADTQAAFTIDQVTLTVHPGNNVTSGTFVTLRCEAKVSHSYLQPLTYTFNFLLDDHVIYSKNISDSVVGRNLSSARVSNSGRYHCTVRVFNKMKTSNYEALSVTGFQVPILKVESGIAFEGENIIATCSAPEEMGSLIFFFYEGNNKVKQVRSSNNSLKTTFATQKPTVIHLSCKYMVLMHPNAGISNKSNIVKVTVKDLAITPEISISPKVNVVEGDRVRITCQVQNHSDLELFLTKDNTVLHTSHTTFTHSLTVRAEDSGNYVCKAEKGSLQKTAVFWLNVTELFSKPNLRMNPDQVFEGEQFTLNCFCAVSSPEKINEVDIKYKLLKEDRQIYLGANYYATASPATNGKYSCMAMAKGVNKTSQPLDLKAKVPVSIPIIRAVEKVIVGRPFKVLCEAENGTLPITYNLLKASMSVNETRVDKAAHKALFSINFISHPKEIDSFTCQAHNQGPLFRRTSQPLIAEVIVPVSKPVLEVLDDTVTESSDLTLICRVQKGSYPITYTWYHKNVPLPFSTKELRSLEGRYTVKDIERDQRGDYYCEASNYGTEIKRSFPVRIGVSLAVWKKALIGVFCILLLVAIAIVLTVFLKKMSKPHINKQASELSVKPSRPKSGDPMRMSLTLDIEDNTALNGTPCVMGRNVWSENVSGSDSDDHTDEDSELVQPQEVDPSREVPVKKSIEPEYSGQHTEVQVSTPGDSEQAEGVSDAQC